ncbi:MAG: oxidoreductase [Candidatus Nanopelagicales bacterium]|jgi:NAD(P)-dependent dehydrogenase (short-subunit alcohol dehydrogenase family)|nr:oxidoreductase [Candidatus Nanopelagicales bacterium]
MTWSITDVPDLTGRTIVVTGGNSGIGLEAARVLADRGAAVTLAVRDLVKGGAAAADLQRTASAPVEVARLDLADLASVRDFAKAWPDAHPQGLDVLVNNAGVMAIPRRETVDGFEMQLATNHLGHFALTGLLLPALRPDARVVTVSSGVHRMGRMAFDDLQHTRRYQRWAVYGQSKLANLLFALELHRRAEAAGADLRSIAVHPGYAATNLQAVGPQMSGSRIAMALSRLGNRVLAQSAEAGAWPTIMGATDPDVPSGAFLGPTGLAHQRGLPGYETPSQAARDLPSAARLWAVSQDLTGVTYPW